MASRPPPVSGSWRRSGCAAGRLLRAPPSRPGSSSSGLGPLRWLEGAVNRAGGAACSSSTRPGAAGLRRATGSSRTAAPRRASTGLEDDRRTSSPPARRDRPPERATRTPRRRGLRRPRTTCTAFDGPINEGACSSSSPETRTRPGSSADTLARLGGEAARHRGRAPEETGRHVRRERAPKARFGRATPARRLGRRRGLGSRGRRPRGEPGVLSARYAGEHGDDGRTSSGSSSELAGRRGRRPPRPLRL